MLRRMVVWVSLTYLTFFFLISDGFAQKRPWGISDLQTEANQVWKGEYAPEDLQKWKERAKQFDSKNAQAQLAMCINVIGVILYNDGNLDDALGHFNQSLEICRKNNFEKLISRNLQFIGLIQMNQGKGDDAFASFKESAEIAKKNNILFVAGKSTRLMGTILYHKGRYMEAMNILKESLLYAEEIGDESLRLFCLFDIGIIHKIQGFYEKAKEHFSQSLEISQKLELNKWIAFNVIELGDIASRQKDYQRAAENYQKAMPFLEASPDRKALLKLYQRMGINALRMRDPGSALQHLEKSYTLAKEMGMKLYLAQAAENIGKAYLLMGKWDEALKRTEEAIEIHSETGLLDNLRECHFQKGILLEKKGDTSGAKDHYEISVKLLESLREETAGGKEEQITFVEKRSKVYQNLIQLLMQQGKPAEALEYLERSRLHDLRNQFDTLNPNLNNEKEDEAREKEKKLREQIEETRTWLVEEKSKSKEEKNIDKIARLEDQLRVKKQDYIEYINDLREKFPELASLLAVQPDSLIDLQGLLTPDVALIQYLMLPESLYIFVVTNSVLYHKEVMVKQTDIEAKIEYLRSILMNPQIPLNLGSLDTTSLKPVEARFLPFYEMFMKPLIDVSHELYDCLIKPVEKDVEKFSVLGIIPNGKLHLLPFQVLGKKDSNGEIQFLLKKKAVFYLNSQSVLKFAQKRSSRIGSIADVLAFGNPDNSLHHAEEEIRKIKEVFSKSKSYVGKNASEDKLKNELSGFNVLHLATHGTIKDNIKESHILFAPSSDGKEDGRLLIKEIWGLPLNGYQLVTLSACETALGKEASGDVMVSLETAFLRAGTPTIVASLWKVDDQATGNLMKSFYYYLKTQGKAEALRSAQTALMNDSRYIYPYYWAPFILVGDWR